MGNGIAHVFAQNGFSVTLIDLKQEVLDKALATIAKNLDRQVAKSRYHRRTENPNPCEYHPGYLSKRRRISSRLGN
jgi:3-hydroxyacyl-CoA dehydrogenase